MQKNKFIVGGVVDGRASISPNPVEHYHESDAKAEAERLAQAHRGKTFVVLKIVGSVVAGGIQWN